MRRISIFTWVTAGLICLTLYGCGFHLRVTAPSLAKLDPIYVDAPPNIRPQLVSQLQKAGACITALPKSATLSLHVIRAEMGLPRTHLNASYRTQTYRLIYHLVVQLTNRSGKRLPAQDFSREAPMTVGRNQSIDSDRQTADIRRMLTAQALEQLMGYLVSPDIHRFAK